MPRKASPFGLLRSSRCTTWPPPPPPFINIHAPTPSKTHTTAAMSPIGSPSFFTGPGVDRVVARGTDAVCGFEGTETVGRACGAGPVLRAVGTALDLFEGPGDEGRGGMGRVRV